MTTCNFSRSFPVRGVTPQTTPQLTWTDTRHGSISVIYLRIKAMQNRQKIGALLVNVLWLDKTLGSEAQRISKMP
jgi:hypothetical protein